MGIDGIGNQPPPTHLDGLGAVETQEADLGRTESTTGSAAGAVSSTERGLLGQLEQGQITREQYLDGRVDEAISPFASRLSPEQLDHLRSTLREQLESEPALVELVRRATQDVHAR